MVNLIKMVKVLLTKEISGKSFLKATCEFFGKQQDLSVLSLYGISFNPPVNSFGVSVSPNGYGDDAFVIIDRPDLRFTQLESGELKVGNYVTGSYVYFKADGTILIKGDVTVDGTVEADNFITSTVSDYNAHTHSGVQSGGSNTGGPS